MKKVIPLFAKTAICFSLIIAMFSCNLAAYAQDAEAGSSEMEPFIRIDRDDPEAYDRDLENLRFITGDRYEFVEVSKKYGIEPDYVPDETGLATLDISASAQFNDWQFRILAEQLREAADGKEIYIVDLRRESHAFLSGRPFSVYGLHNWTNQDLSAEESKVEEEQLFRSFVGFTLTACPKADDGPGEAYEYAIESFITEKKLVESEGLHYIRIPVQDHTWPDPDAIDKFIDLIKEVGIEILWLHIRCHAGKGRPGAFLAIYDKMKNPEVSMEEIAVRQAMLGGTYLLYTEDSDSYKVPLYREKYEMTWLFDQYVAENKDSNYEISWSEWLNAQEFEEAA